MKPPRFRLRTLLIAVAVVAVALGVGLMARRSAIYRDAAVRHALEAEALANARGYAEPDGIVRRRANHHARLRDKYLRAAARPWLGVEEDPPLPDYSE